MEKCGKWISEKYVILPPLSLDVLYLLLPIGACNFHG